MSDVSYRALQLVRFAAQQEGHDVAALLAAGDLAPADLSRRGYFSWERFCAVLDAAADVLGGAEHLRRWGQCAAEVESTFRPSLNLLGSMLEPRSAYVVVHRIVGPRMFPLVEPGLEVLGERELRIVLSVPPHRADSTAWFWTVAGAFQVVPRIFGLADAEVTAEIQPHRGHFVIGVPARRSWLRGLKNSARGVLRWRELVEELADQTAEMREQHAQLALARRQAEESSRAKSRFAAALSHEVRTPVNAIAGMSELLLQSETTPEQREMIETVQAASRHLAQVVGGVLDLAKIEAGHLELHPAPFPLEAALLDVQRIFTPACAAKGLVLDVKLAPGTPAHVLIDGTRLMQVLVNLVSNAVKFTPEGRVRVSVRAESEGLRFDVEDTGPGISAEMRAALFEPFVQGDTNAAPDGSGLGLTIARTLSTSLGGRISVESEGRGSLFSLWVPAPPAHKEVPFASPPARSGLKVLVVEDDAVSAKVARRLLERQGCSVEVAADGEAALLALLAEGYDVVFMDCHLPKKSGWETTRALRGSEGPNREVPVYALTACGLAEDKQRCFEAGMSGYLDKPVSDRALADVLAEVSAGAPASPLAAHPRDPLP